MSHLYNGKNQKKNWTSFFWWTSPVETKTSKEKLSGCVEVIFTFCNNSLVVTWASYQNWPRVIRAPRSSQPDCVLCSDSRLFWLAVRSNSSAIPNICCKYITMHIGFRLIGQFLFVLSRKTFTDRYFPFLFNRLLFRSYFNMGQAPRR